MDNDLGTFNYELEKFRSSFKDVAKLNFETYRCALQMFPVDVVLEALRQCAGKLLEAREVAKVAAMITKSRSEEKATSSRRGRRSSTSASTDNETMNRCADSWKQQNQELQLEHTVTHEVGTDRIKQLRREFEDEFCGGFEGE